MNTHSPDVIVAQQTPHKQITVLGERQNCIQELTKQLQCYTHVHALLNVYICTLHHIFSSGWLHTKYIHGKYVYSTLALGKEREIVKEETALKERRKKQYTVMYMYMYIYNIHVHVHV